MSNNQELIFRNRQFTQLKWILYAFPIGFVVFFLLFPSLRSGALAGVLGLMFFLPVYLLGVFYAHPRQYVLKDKQLILRRVWFKNKVIEINDITSLNVSKMTCLNLRYKTTSDKKGFIKMIIPELEMRLFQEELMKRNSAMEIIYDNTDY